MKHAYRTIRGAAALGIGLMMAGLACAGGAKASTLTTIYSFCDRRDCADGNGPDGPLVKDAAGNYYGLAERGGHFRGICSSQGCGTIYEIPAGARKKHLPVKVLYKFCKNDKCSDGVNPIGGLIIDTSGNLYGVTEAGGKTGNGVVFRLSPDGTLNVLHNFCRKDNCPDGDFPITESTALTYPGAAAGVPYDGVSTLYGEVTGGGSHNCGVIFSLAPKAKKWSEKVLYNFCSVSGELDGDGPNSIVADAAGNLYGVAIDGGSGRSGVVFKLQGSTMTTLYSFCIQANCADGKSPFGAPTLDAQGNLYGTTSGGGTNASGVLYKITPEGSYSKLYDFCSQASCADGSGPAGTLYLDADGNLFGTTGGGGAANRGTVYEMSGTYQVLYSFCNGVPNCTDGENPDSSVVPDGNGNLLGVTADGGGGRFGQGGTIFEFTP
jgi:uncharacterized repeat protein (TIGR03803 family)